MAAIISWKRAGEDAGAPRSGFASLLNICRRALPWLLPGKS